MFIHSLCQQQEKQEGHPALVDSVAASLGRGGRREKGEHLFSLPEQGQPPRSSDMALFIWCISLARVLEISARIRTKS